MVGGSDLNGRSTASRAGSTVGSVGSHIASSLTSSTSAGSSGRGTRPVRKAAGRGRGTSDASVASKGSSSASGGLTSATTHEKTPKATPVKVPGAPLSSPAAATSEQSPAVFRSGEDELDWSVFFMRLAQHRNTCISEFNERFSYLVPLLRYLVQCSGEGANLNRPSMTITRKEYDAFVRFFPAHSMMEDIAWMNEKRFFMLGAHTQGVEAELKKKRKPRVSYYQSAEDSDNPVSEDVQYTKGDFLLRPSRTQKGKIAVTYLVEDFTPRHILIDDLNPHSDFSFSFNGYKPPRGTLGDPSLSPGKGSLRQYVDLLSSDASQPFFKRGCGTCVPPSQAQTSPLRPLFRDDPGTASSADVSGQCNVGINSMSTDTWDGFIQTEGYSGTRENSDATNPLSFSGVSEMCDKDFSYITPTKVCLGRGSFGEVFKAVDTRTNECLALKRMSRAGGPSQWEKIRREITIMARLEHPNIVKYHGSATKAETGCLEIYMELMSESLLETTKRLHVGPDRGSADDIMDALTRYGRQVVSGLKYLHDNNVVHRDIKPANILVSADRVVKLSDFGTAKSYECTGLTQDTAAPVGTIAFMAPELLLHSASNKVPGKDETVFACRKQSDIWSLGCTLLMLYTGRMPWREFSDNWMALLFKMESDKQAIPEIPDGTPPAVNDLLRGMLDRASERRVTIHDLADNPFFGQ